MITTIKINVAHLKNVERACTLHKSKIVSKEISNDKEDWKGTEIYKVAIEHENGGQLFSIGFSTGTRTKSYFQQK